MVSVLDGCKGEARQQRLVRPGGAGDLVSKHTARDGPKPSEEIRSRWQEQPNAERAPAKWML